jgi:hypothetical protein
VVAVVVLVEAVVGSDDLGVLNAPVLCFWRVSKISCSSLERRGGDGGVAKDLDEAARVVMAVNRRRYDDLVVERIEEYIEFILTICCDTC